MLRPFNGQSPQLAATAWVDTTALVIGEVALAEDVSVWPMAVIRGDINRIRIGARSNIQDGTVIHVTHDGPYTPGGYPTSLGEDVTVGHRAIVHACTVGNRVLIGMGAILMDAAEVDDEVMIAANALVPPGKRLHSGWLYVGSPARAVRQLRPAEREQLRYSARYYVQLKERHRPVRN
ncbi:gamma carbonic anhydrase family protein [Nitrococcus mobilis]|uniref:Carbonic anhydrase/acetyltransferase, isoleucine patch superfamily protein n=1 Tax=Nitrococcus mobilis Nb-231 TaxID=314278 RepID=A4BVQ4_9GAMM|nr:gamma carbonic anhydrase family protein [Nitrococcus mobilis]EAR20207.1 Carbonic anhydrase/acetyltransferase, isoleucine patch superfamily protein [Nitrococcus mobilis Nb-231]